MGIGGKPIVVVGSINLDLVAKADRIPAPGETVHGSEFQMHPGGKGANQAVAVARACCYLVSGLDHLDASYEDDLRKA